jgi:hypothetical protein
VFHPSAACEVFGVQQAASSRRQADVKLRHLLAQEGEAALIRRIGISRQTLYRALAGLPIRAGSHALIERVIRQTLVLDAGVEEDDS